MLKKKLIAPIIESAKATNLVKLDLGTVSILSHGRHSTHVYINGQPAHEVLSAGISDLTFKVSYDGTPELTLTLIPVGNDTGFENAK